MEYISYSDLSMIGEGANGRVYKYNKPLPQSGLNAVVKVSNRLMPQKVLESYAYLKQAGVMTLAFLEECRVDGLPAILMEDLFTDKMVYVSPNSVRNRYFSNLPEKYLLNNKLNDIANIDSLLVQLRDLVNCTDGKGIGLDMDMISFGVEKDNKDSEVYYKLVDIDGMLYDSACCFTLHECNTLGAKEALRIFVDFFIETSLAKQRLLQKIDSYKW